MVTNSVVVVTRDGLGSVAPGDEAFGLTMFDKFIHTLESSPEKPRTMCFYTLGVRLLCEGSPALLGLQLLQGLGVRIVACQTCLDHYGLREQLRVGETGGMNEIVAILTAADAVITI